MRNYLDILADRYPVRNTEEQKEEFRKYIEKEALYAGYKVKVEELDNHKNILIGDVENAKTIFTAHYDTPRRAIFPNLLIPCKRWLYWVYQFSILIPMLLISFAAAGICYYAVPLDYSVVQNRLLPLSFFLVAYYTLFFILFRGKPNKHNVNDNTSGTATVLETMFSMPDNLKSKVAFILFDDEEKGKKGSKAFAAEHTEIKEKTPVINFDCVGNGDNFVYIGSSEIIKQDIWNTFKDSFGADNSVFTDDKHAKSNSDHVNFKISAAVMACKKNKHGLLYTDLIHTKKDTVARFENIEKLCNSGIKFIDKI